MTGPLKATPPLYFRGEAEQALLFYAEWGLGEIVAAVAVRLPSRSAAFSAKAREFLKYACELLPQAVIFGA